MEKKPKDYSHTIFRLNLEAHDKEGIIIYKNV